MEPLSTSGIFEIPKSIRYDFLIGLLGIVNFGIWAWFSFIENKSNSVTFFFVLSWPLLAYGFSEMLRNYHEENVLNQLRGIVERKRIYDDLSSHNIITKKEYSFLVKLLKDNMKKRIENKKEELKDTKEDKKKR